MNDVIELLKSHRSIRKFSDRQIPRELLIELIQAGQGAATSSHVQAYTVIHVKNQANREQIAELAQNVAVAAESEGLGICYIGGIRNNPQAISDLLRLPEHVYPVFGMCLGYPDHDPEVKPRLPVEAVLKEDYYTEDGEQVKRFDATMQAYYQARSSSNKNTDWSHNLKPLFDTKLRPHMRDFLIKRGFEMK